MDLAIIGGGASGMAAAIAAKRAFSALNVTIYERNPRVGKKLLATGNGQCNILNRFAEVSRYHGEDPAFIDNIFGQLGFKGLCYFWNSLGIEIIEKENGKCYPRSLQAASVLDALRLECDRLGVNTVCEAEITAIKKEKNGFSLKTKEGFFRADRVIMAAGNLASQKLGGTDSGIKLLETLGHKSNKLLPSIVQLKTDTTFTKAISGIKFEGVARLYGRKNTPVREEEGEILFTDYGVSGPAILNLSGAASRMLQKGTKPMLLLDLLPEMKETELLSLLIRRRKQLSSMPLEHFLSGILNKRLGQTALKVEGIGPLSRRAETLSNDELQSLCRRLKSWDLTVTDTNGMVNAQVTAGGVLTKDFDPFTLCSRLVPGLYACGEVLDIDGDCGGFNLQWAWASGLTAGQNAALSLKGEN